MNNSVQRALYGFLSGFGIPAYNTDTVPDDAVEPYLTFPPTLPEWNTPATFFVNVYYRDNKSNYAVMAKAEEIAAAIGDRGVRIPCDGGVVVINPQNPLIQTIPENEGVRGAYLNLQLNAYYNPGT